MPALPTLTDKEVRALDQPGKYRAAQGLYVIITEAGSKSWYCRVTQQSGKRSWRVLGECDKLSIREAQKQAILLTGEKVEKSARGRTFGTAYKEFIELHKSSWKNESSERQWNQSFKDYIDPKIGSMAVAEIKPFHIADLLKPIWIAKSETARRVRGRVEKVIDYEQSRLGILDANPAQMRFMRNLLPKQKDQEEHLSAPTIEELRELYQSLGQSVSHRALKWTIEHLCRTSETREAMWSEIKGDVWTIPAARMKGGKSHKSPKFGKALQEKVIKQAKELPDKFSNSKKADIILERLTSEQDSIDISKSAIYSWIRDSSK